VQGSRQSPGEAVPIEGVVIGVPTLVITFAGISVILGIIWFFTRKPGHFGGGARFPAGTRAFESEMSLPLLARLIEARERALLGPVDDAERAKLTTQIANLRNQAVLHQAVIDAGDVSPGRMSIGANPDSDQID